MPLFETKKSSIMQDHSVLDTQSEPPDGIPLCRETLLTFMASNVSNIFTSGRARNMFVWGSPGTGKTASVQYLLKEVQKHSKETNSPVNAAYVNAGRTRNPYYTLLEILKQLNISVPEVGWQFFRLKQAFENTLKEKPVLIAIDEVENVLFKEKEPLIYYLNRQPKTTLILISNKLSQATQLPERCLSTLQPEMILFSPYSEDEAFQILRARAQRAFKPNVISDELIWTIAKATEEMSDIRFGISMLLTAGQAAEQNQRAQINKQDVDFAIENTRKIKTLTSINELSKRIKKHTGRTINF
ncbi:MAG TPA: AAA family ATPase [Verrucomicrobiae bacterium]|nr:AAA family ATPase [Verrucomicrobiae bacterium]